MVTQRQPAAGGGSSEHPNIGVVISVLVKDTGGAQLLIYNIKGAVGIPCTLYYCIS